MSRALFISVSPGEIWAAPVVDNALAALRVMRTANPSRVGAIIYGRIVALRPELPAALVDIGEERPGFLDAKAADPKRGIAGLTEGQAVIVAVTKDARADKAAGLRLFRGKGERLARIEEAARKAKPPALLEPPLSALASLLADFLEPRPDRIVIDDRNGFAEARRFLARQGSDLSDRVELYQDALPLFEEAAVAGTIETALSARVELPGDGALTFETTQAAVMIDVDGGKASALSANLDAARAVARQTRLRNLAGPIVVDFIGMKKRGDRDKVLAALKAALADDPEKPEILGWTRLGHVELVRRRRLPSLHDILFERDPHGGWRKTALTTAFEALRAVAREAMAQPGKALILAAHPDIVGALETGEGAAARRSLEERLQRPLRLEPRASYARETFDIRAGSTI